ALVPAWVLAATPAWMASIILVLPSWGASYWRLPRVSSAWPTAFCEVAALLEMNCMRRLSAVSWTMLEGWSPPCAMVSDSWVTRAAWPSSVWPQALAMASYQLVLAPEEAGLRAVPALAEAMKVVRPAFGSVGLMLISVLLVANGTSGADIRPARGGLVQWGVAGASVGGASPAPGCGAVASPSGDPAAARSPGSSSPTSSPAGGAGSIFSLRTSPPTMVSAPFSLIPDSRPRPSGRTSPGRYSTPLEASTCGSSPVTTAIIR